MTGIHPKVAVPAIVQLLVGLALVVAGLLAHDDTVLTAGLSLIAASAGTLGLGYRAPPA